jgi:hypothetical protein
VKELTKDERVRLIVKTLKDCGEPVTVAAVAERYRYETGEPLTDMAWATKEATHEVE